VSELYALDIETSGLSRFQDRILAVGVFAPGFNQCFDSAADFNAWLCSRPSPPLFIMHNGSFDTGFLKHAGINVDHLWLFDTRSVASLLTPRPVSLGLESLANVYLGYPPYKLDRKQMESYSQEEIKAYCLKDCKITWELFHFLKAKLSQRAWGFVESWIMPATKFCAVMEYDGVYVDKKGLESYQEGMIAKRDQLLVELKELSKEALKHFHELQVREVSQNYMRSCMKKRKSKPKTKRNVSRRYAAARKRRC
jgi:DNA polymerase I-like protein with 3'-5' exonuclease and polymerase domains